MIAAAPTRRAMLGIFAAAPIVAGITSSAYAAVATTFDARLAEFRRLEAISDMAEAESDAARTAYFTCRPVRLLSPVCHVGDTVESYNARVADERADYEATDLAALTARRVQWHSDRCQATSDAAHTAMESLIAMPAPTVASVAIKLELAMRCGWSAEDLTPLLDDLRRLGSH